MYPYIVNIINEKFALFSLSDFAFSEENIPACADADYIVVLSPSLIADFRITAWGVSQKTLFEYYSAALSAADFLISERGLPLSEISFETPCGIVEISITYGGILKFDIQKCKLKYIKTAEIAGVAAKYADVDVSFSARVVKLFSAEGSAPLLSKLYLMQCSLPACIVLYEFGGEKLTLKKFTEHAKYKVTNLGAFCAASYSAYYTGECGGERMISSSSGDVKCEIKSSSVSVYWKNCLQR